MKIANFLHSGKRDAIPERKSDLATIYLWT